MNTHISYLRFPSDDYFVQSMNYFRKKYDNKVKFIVASDDITWCKERSYFSGGDVYFTIPGSRDTANFDFAIISSCDDMIISRGTFGWWSGYLSYLRKGGQVIYIMNTNLF